MRDIKNWSEAGESNSLPEWENDQTELKIRIKENPLIPGSYIVEGKNPDGPWFEAKSITQGNSLVNKQDAIDLTVDWMKDNPNPKSSL